LAFWAEVIVGINRQISRLKKQKTFDGTVLKSPIEGGQGGVKGFGFFMGWLVFEG
jgi:hypothetical protein